MHSAARRIIHYSAAEPARILHQSSYSGWMYVRVLSTYHTQAPRNMPIDFRTLWKYFEPKKSTTVRIGPRPMRSACQPHRRRLRTCIAVGHPGNQARTPLLVFSAASGALAYHPLCRRSQRSILLTALPRTIRSCPACRRLHCCHALGECHHHHLVQHGHRPPADTGRGCERGS